MGPKAMHCTSVRMRDRKEKKKGGKRNRLIVTSVVSTLASPFNVIVYFPPVAPASSDFRLSKSCTRMATFGFAVSMANFFVSRRVDKITTSSPATSTDAQCVNRISERCGSPLSFSELSTVEVAKKQRLVDRNNSITTDGNGGTIAFPAKSATAEIFGAATPLDHTRANKQPRQRVSLDAILTKRIHS